MPSLASALSSALGIAEPRRFDTPITIKLNDRKGEITIRTQDKKVSRLDAESCEICGDIQSLYDRGDLVVCGRCR